MSYAKGHNSWGDPGIYSSGEILEFSLINSKFYNIEEFLKISATAGKDGATFSKDTTKVPISYRVQKSKINSLYAQLTTAKNNFTLEFIQPRLKAASKKEILAIAAANDLLYKFEDEEKADLKNDIKKIRNFDKLDSFINLRRPDPKWFTSTVDGWDNLQISFIGNGDTIIFQQDFLNVLGQPILEHKVNQHFVNVQFVNLKANILLGELLPGLSIIRRRVDIDNFTRDYVKWYIEKVLN